MGRAFVFGDNIDTDVIVPGRFLNLSAPEDLAKICMTGYEENFASKINTGDVFVAGNNFGCGSSREHAPISIKAVGVNCVIAESFARIFYRNAINIGLPLLELREATALISEGDDISVNFLAGTIVNLTKQETYQCIPFPHFILEIFNAGGMTNYIKENFPANKM